jgi:transposase
MKNPSSDEGVASIGIDVGDKRSRFCVLGGDKSVREQSSVETTPAAFKEVFSRYRGTLVALEVGTHSLWASRLLEECGHRVVVVNSRKLEILTKNIKKTDKKDAEILARAALSDLDLLAPVQHRTPETQSHRVLLALRDAAVQSRTKLITSVRGLVKPFGARLPRCSASAFAKKVLSCVPANLKESVTAVLELIAKTTEVIKAFDRQVEDLGNKRYPATQHLQHVEGIGPVTSLAYVLAIEDPTRFRSSRSVGSYFGLTPRLDNSSGCEPQLRITKAGDEHVRRLLVQSAQYILGQFGPDSDLRRFGLLLAQRGGKNAKKRAVVAVARKLAVLLHRLWITGEVYDPLRVARKSQVMAATA